jgi:hypothetical protein
MIPPVMANDLEILIGERIRRRERLGGMRNYYFRVAT